MRNKLSQDKIIEIINQAAKRHDEPLAVRNVSTAVALFLTRFMMLNEGLREYVIEKINHMSHEPPQEDFFESALAVMEMLRPGWKELEKAVEEKL